MGWAVPWYSGGVRCLFLCPFCRRIGGLPVPQIKFWCSSNITVSCSVLRTFLSLFRAKQISNFASMFALELTSFQWRKPELHLDWFTYICPPLTSMLRKCVQIFLNTRYMFLFRFFKWHLSFPFGTHKLFRAIYTKLLPIGCGFQFLVKYNRSRDVKPFFTGVEGWTLGFEGWTPRLGGCGWLSAE